MSICKLEEIKNFFNSDNTFNINDKQVEEYFNMISNPCNKVKNLDKIWILYSENRTVNSSIQKIANITNDIYEEIDYALKDFKKYKNKKPRIPFYIWVLYLIDEQFIF